MGDSLTQGYNLIEESRWTNLLENSIKSEVINCGINGDTTTGMLGRLTPILKEYRPSHLIILGGTNDVWFGLTNAQIIANIHAMVRQALYYNVLPIVGIPTSIMDVSLKNNLNENYCERMAQFQHELKDYCIKDGQLYIPFYENLNETHFLKDGLHPNETGQHVIKQLVFSVLEPTL